MPWATSSDHKGAFEKVKDNAFQTCVEGATTLYEGGIHMARGLSGLSKKKAMAHRAEEWLKYTRSPCWADVTAPSPSEHIHPALWAVSR